MAHLPVEFLNCQNFSILGELKSRNPVIDEELPQIMKIFLRIFPKPIFLAVKRAIVCEYLKFFHNG